MSAAQETVRIIRVFVSSPGDVAEERAVMAEVVDSINRTDGKNQRIRLELFTWEDNVVPQIGPKPQQVVDSQTPAYDIYVGIMSTRFGSPTGRYGSGTEKEFKDALKQWKAAGSPWILFYFDNAPSLSSDSADVEQYLRVCRFREGLQKQGLYTMYKGVRGSADGFYEKASLHLRKIIQHFTTLQTDQTPKQAPRPSSTDKVKNLKPTVPPEYTEWLLGRCGEVELMGLEIKHGSGVRLNHVYTPLATSSRAEETKRGKRQQDEEAMPQERESNQLLALLDKQSLYVSGDPGSGKSTFCRWVTWLTCNGQMPTVDVPAPGQFEETFPDQLRGRLPVLVRLRDFWQHLPPDGIHSVALGSLEQALELWLADQKYPGMNWPCLKGHLQHGSALLMLDGVDEVPPVRKSDSDAWYPREMLLTGLAEAVAYWTKAGNRVLVTSRPYGLSSEQQRKLALQPAPILGLDQELQALLVRRWFLRLKEDHGLGLETADAMIHHIHVERGLDDLAVNPLLLTAMCIIYDEGKRLPHDKYTLYDRIVDTVLHKRYAGREGIDPIRGRLAAVALGMHTGEALAQNREAPEAFVSAKEMDRVLESYHQLDGSTDAGLRDIASVREDLLSQSGLLVDRGDEGASFYHLSIQEFLAAERLFLLFGRDQKQLPDLLLKRGRTAGWRNTVSFVFGCLVATFKSHAGVECLQQFAKRLELPVPDPSGRGPADGVWTSAIVLGDCLQILVGRKAAVPEDLIGFFRNCVFRAIEQEIAVKDRQALAVALGRLGDPRVAEDLRLSTHPDDHPGYLKIPAGKYCVGDDKKPITIDEPYWLSKYPVTNLQYALFVDDGGYSRQEFWPEEGWQWIQSEGIKAPDYWRNPEFNAPNQPVVGVSWWEAEAFCKWAWIRVYATPADPMPDDHYLVIVSVEVFENGTWNKESNSTIGELIRKPDSPEPQLIDRQNGSEEGIILTADGIGTYLVWAGICRENQSYWNHTNVTILRRNTAPVAIAQLSTENETSWSTYLEVDIEPGEEITIFFNGSLSNDQDGDALDHFWDVDGKGAIDDLTGPWVNWTFSEDGLYPILLTVGDGNVTSDVTIKLLIRYAILPDINITTAPFINTDEIMTGDPLNITARIQNQGDNVTGDFIVYVYSQNLDTFDNRLINKIDVGSMAVNEFKTISFDWTTTHLVEEGAHVLRIYADAEYHVLEENESNNQAWSQPFRISTDHEPFITIEDLSISNETPMLFELVNITLTISNTGTGPGELLTIYLLVNGEEYDIRYLPHISPESNETLVLRYYTDTKGSYNLTCEVYDNGMIQDSQGTRIVIQDLPRPHHTDKNDTEPEEDDENLDWLMMGAGVFMIFMAIVIQLVGYRAREK